MDMGRTPGVEVVAPRVRAGTDGRERIHAIFIRENPAPTMKIRIEWGVMLVVVVQVASGRIRLPDFDERIRYGTPCIVKYTPRDDDPLADRGVCFDSISRQIVVQRVNGIHTINRPGQFGKALPERNQRARGGTGHCGFVSRVQIGRMAFLIQRLEWLTIFHGYSSSNSAMTRLAAAIAEFAAGTPAYTATCNSISLMSSIVTSVFRLARTCIANSCSFPSAASIARVSRCRVRRSIPCRAQTMPQAVSVMKRWKSMSKLVLSASAWSTWASPRTSRRIFIPCS